MCEYYLEYAPIDSFAIGGRGPALFGRPRLLRCLRHRLLQKSIEGNRQTRGWREHQYAWNHSAKKACDAKWATQVGDAVGYHGLEVCG